MDNLTKREYNSEDEEYYIVNDIKIEEIDYNNILGIFSNDVVEVKDDSEDEKTSLNNFMNTEITIEGETIQDASQFICTICDKAFAYKSSLSKHLISHNRFRCSICNKAFVQKTLLLQHLKHHNGSKEYKCMLCGKGFTLIGPGVENGLSRFKCTICKKAPVIHKGTKKFAVMNSDEVATSSHSKKTEGEVHCNIDHNAQQLKIERLNNIIKQKDEEIQKIRARNYRLQEQLINGLDEIRGAISKIKHTNSQPKINNTNIETDNDGLVTGFRRESDDMIHLGRDIWMPSQIFDSIVCNSRTKAQFVKNCAVAIFGKETLKRSSVTGSASNRCADRVARPKLDGTKMLALRDIFEYYLCTHMSMSNRVEIDLELNQIGTYVSHKIADLLRKRKDCQIQVLDTTSNKFEDEFMILDNSDAEM